MTDIPQIAARLDDAQKFWIGAAKANGDLVGGGYCIGDPLVALDDSRTPHRFYLTDLGLDVAQYLRSQAND